MTDTKVHPCNVCGKDAVACLSPDIDIKGLCYCEAHKEEAKRQARIEAIASYKKVLKIEQELQSKKEVK